jgi:hypothetical protein
MDMVALENPKQKEHKTMGVIRSIYSEQII